MILHTIALAITKQYPIPDRYYVSQEEFTELHKELENEYHPTYGRGPFSMNTGMSNVMVRDVPVCPFTD